MIICSCVPISENDLRTYIQETIPKTRTKGDILRLIEIELGVAVDCCACKEAIKKIIADECSLKGHNNQ